MMTASRLLYWIAVIVGALIVFALVHKSSRKGGVMEGFADNPNTPGDPTTPSGQDSQDARASNYTEQLYTATPTPNAYWPAEFTEANMISYLSAFSDITKAGSATYGNFTWHDMKDSSMDFTVQLTQTGTDVTLPTTIKTRAEGNPSQVTDMGMRLKGVKLIGASSQAYGTQLTNSQSYKLPSFTMCMFGVIESLDFPEGETRKLVFQLTAEHPDVIQFAISRRDSRNVMVEVVLGKTVYKWVVDKNTMMANRLATMYGIVYDDPLNPPDSEHTPEVRFHIGGSVFRQKITEKQPILLGNTEVKINPTGQLDMKLLSFGFFKTAASEESMRKLQSYFVRQQSGIDLILQQQQNDYTSMQEEYERQIKAATRTLETVEEELSQCKEAAEKALAANPRRHWQISMEQGQVSTVASRLSPDDLKKCTPLRVASHIAGSAAAGAASSGATSTSTASQSGSAPSRAPRIAAPAPPPTTTTTTRQIVPPPASASDPSASLEERVNDALR